MTPEQVQTFKFHATVEGIDFDVPVNYFHQEFAMLHVWPRPTRAQLEGRVRRKADDIEITALLPVIAPYTEANAAEFEQPGWGKKVRASLSKRRRGLASWSYYFSYAGSRLVQQPASAVVPGMVYYRDPVTDEDVYFSNDHPEKNMTRIICKGKEKEWQYSYCKVETTYLDRFDLDLTFSRQYLGQWRVIVSKLQGLFDGFREAAQQQPQKK